MWASRFASLAIHAALIGAAIRLSERPPAIEDEPIQAFTLAIPNVHRPAAPPSPGSSIGDPSPGVSFDPSHIPTSIPPAGSEVTPTFIPTLDPGLPGGDSLRLLPGGQSLIGVVVDARLADEAPRLLNHPPLHYPELLRQAGIEGRVEIEAVIDTLGRVERGSMRVAASAHELFSAQALALVEGSRYVAGRFDGRAVRVRVRVPVVFSLER